MAELHRTTLGNTLILEVNATPNAAITAPRGSKAYDSATGDEYVNTNGAQAWTKLAKTGDAPTSHAASHIGGAGDAIADAVAAGAAGLMSGADKTKLDGVEALADVTDATNVNAAGAVMESDAVTPISRLTLGATSTLAANVIGAATETIHTALTLTSAMLNTARRWVKWRALLRVVTANGADTWQIRARCGAVGGILLVDSTAKDIAAGDLVEIQGDIFIDTIGAALTAKIQTLTMIAGSGNFATPITTRVFDETNPTTEASNTLVVTGTCNTADAGNTVSLVAFEAEVMPA